MFGEIFGPDLLIVLLVAIAFIAVPIWAIIDAANTPAEVFNAAGSSKAWWIAVIAVTTVLTGFVGFVVAVVYLAMMRRKLRTV